MYLVDGMTMEDLDVGGKKILEGPREIGWEGVDWIHLAQDRDQWQVTVNTVMKLRVPLKARNFLTSWVTISFSRRTVLHGVI
jgi:hypothetical protein